MLKRIIYSLFIISLLPLLSLAQDDIDSLLNAQKLNKKEFVFATFKATRIINGQSVEKIPFGTLEFRVAHRFGSIKDGIYELFGMDQASQRIGFEFGTTKFMSVGFGRSTIQKNYDGFTKISITRQSKGNNSFPLSIVYFGNIVISASKWPVPDRNNLFSSRLSYCNQILIASKLNELISIQLSPTIIHKNLVPTQLDRNTIPALGIAGRFKISNRISFTSEYYYTFPVENMSESEKNMKNSFGVGFDIDTGGHIFQLHFTNAIQMIEKGFITESTDDFFNAQIHFGFNINRQFTVFQPKIQ